jgi:hypothetical protein
MAGWLLPRHAWQASCHGDGRGWTSSAAHRSPVSGNGRAGRLFRLAVALPVPVFAVLAGREWFAEPGAAPGPVLDDILRSRAG